jgi:hypothetical protein
LNPHKTELNPDEAVEAASALTTNVRRVGLICRVVAVAEPVLTHTRSHDEENERQDMWCLSRCGRGG